MVAVATSDAWVQMRPCSLLAFASAVGIGPPFDDNQSFLELFERVSNGLDEESKLPLSLWLFEDPDSPVALPGAACLDLHDCLHILLNRGYSTADEAFVVGFSMGNDRRAAAGISVCWPWCPIAFIRGCIATAAVIFGSSGVVFGSVSAPCR